MRRGTKRGRPLRRPPGKGGSFRMAKAALAGVKKLRRAGEVKFLDHISAGLTIPLVVAALNPTILSLNAEGITSGTRIGRIIEPTSMFFRMCVTRNASASTPQFVRFVIFRDKDSNGVLPVWSGTGGMFSQTSVLSPLNRAEGRYRVVMDKLIPLNAQRLTGQVKKYFRLSGRTTYSGGAATQVNAQQNQYYFFICTDVAANLPNFYLSLRFNYRDT